MPWNPFSRKPPGCQWGWALPECWHLKTQIREDFQIWTSGNGIRRLWGEGALIFQGCLRLCLPGKASLGTGIMNLRHNTQDFNKKSYWGCFWSSLVSLFSSRNLDPDGEDSQRSDRLGHPTTKRNKTSPEKSGNIVPINTTHHIGILPDW